MTSTSPPQAPAPAPPAPPPPPNPAPTGITDDQHVQIWKHLMEDVVRYKVDEDLYNLLQSNGVTDVIELMTEFASNEEDLVKWKYKRSSGSNSGSTYNISKKNIADILALQDYIYSVAAKLLLSSPAQMTFTQFMSLNRQDFAIMRTDPQYKKNRTVTTPPAPAPAPAPATANGNGNGNNFIPRTPAENFQKSIKRDPDQFPELKNDKGFDTWYREVEIQAKVQDVQDVMNSSYTPSSPDEVELFRLKQVYMFSVFVKKLLTNTGKEVVRKHHKTADAQKVIAEVAAHYTRSIGAQLGSDEINHYLVNSNLGDGKWNGTTFDYIVHWQERVRLYHGLVPAASQYNENTLLNMLKRAVNPIPELRSVYQTAQQLAIAMKKTVTYDDYCDLLRNACTTYDDAMRMKGGGRPPKNQRNVYSNSIDYQDDSLSGITPDSSQLEIYNIDTTTAEIEANYAGRGNSPSMTKEQWNQLGAVDPKLQQMWDQFPPEAKAIILRRLPPRPSGKLPGVSSSQSNYIKQQTEKRRINLSEMSALDLLEMIDADDSTSAQDEHDQVGNDDNHLMAFMSEKVEKLHPAHAQRLMSTSQSIESKDSKRSGKNNKSGNSTLKAKVVEYLGKDYDLEANAVTIEYKVSHSSRAKTKALVDRGANGGVAGNDVRIVNRLLARKVDITGVENHQVKDIHIGSVAGYAMSTNGPVIVFMHQQALLCKGTSIMSSVQMEAAGCDVNDKSVKLEGGKQRIIKDGHTFPLVFSNGLPRLKLRPVTDAELDDQTIPHCHLTDDIDWDPTVFDNDEDDDDLEWFNSLQEEQEGFHDPLFNEYGEYRKPVVVNSAVVTDLFLDSRRELEEHVIPAKDIILQVYQREQDSSTHDDGNAGTQPEGETPELTEDGTEPPATVEGEHQRNAREVADGNIDFEKLRPNFAWLPTDIIKRTFECTTQYGRLPMSDTASTAPTTIRMERS